SGGLGIHALQMGRLGGARVIAATSSPDIADTLRSQGADEVIVTERGGDFSAAVMAATDGGLGADIVIDTVGTPVFNAVRKSVAKAGRWVMVGQVTGTFAQFSPAQLFLRDISMLS